MMDSIIQDLKVKIETECQQEKEWSKTYVQEPLNKAEKVKRLDKFQKSYEKKGVIELKDLINNNYVHNSHNFAIQSGIQKLKQEEVIQT